MLLKDELPSLFEFFEGLHQRADLELPQIKLPLCFLHPAGLAFELQHFWPNEQSKRVSRVLQRGLVRAQVSGSLSASMVLLSILVGPLVVFAAPVLLLLSLVLQRSGDSSHPRVLWWLTGGLQLGARLQGACPLEIKTCLIEQIFTYLGRSHLLRPAGAVTGLHQLLAEVAAHFVFLAVLLNPLERRGHFRRASSHRIS